MLSSPLPQATKLKEEKETTCLVGAFVVIINCEMVTLSLFSDEETGHRRVNKIKQCAQFLCS